MSYKEQVMEYGKNLKSESQKDLLSAIKKTIEDGYSYQWIITALNHKDKECWEKFGFGLFFNQGFRTEITKKMNKKEESFFDLDSLPDDGCTITDDSSVPSSSGSNGFASEPVTSFPSSSSNAVRSVDGSTDGCSLSSSSCASRSASTAVPSQEKIVKEFITDFRKSNKDCGLSNEAEERYVNGLFNVCFKCYLCYPDRVDESDDAAAVRYDLGLFLVHDWEKFKQAHPTKLQELIDHQAALRKATNMSHCERQKAEKLFYKNMLWSLPGGKDFSTLSIESVLDGAANLYATLGIKE